MTKVSKKLFKRVNGIKVGIDKRKNGRINPVRFFLAGLTTALFMFTVIFPQSVNTQAGQVLAAFTPAEEKVESFPIADAVEPKRVIWVVVTAYSSDVAQTDSSPCIPANGYNLCEHYEKYGSGNSIAANFLSFDTQVKLPEVFGDKVFIVRDRMNARYNGQARIDVWMPSREEAVRFGVKTLKMEIY